MALVANAASFCTDPAVTVAWANTAVAATPRAGGRTRAAPVRERPMEATAPRREPVRATTRAAVVVAKASALSRHRRGPDMGIAEGVIATLPASVASPDAPQVVRAREAPKTLPGV